MVSHGHGSAQQDGLYPFAVRSDASRSHHILPPTLSFMLSCFICSTASYRYRETGERLSNAVDGERTGKHEDEGCTKAVLENFDPVN